MAKFQQSPSGRRPTVTSIDRQIEDISGQLLTGQVSDKLRADLEKLQTIRRDGLFSGALRSAVSSTRLKRITKHPA